MLAIVLFVGACANTPPGEHIGMTATASCGCCGTIVDVVEGESCGDPAVCAPYCPSDAGTEGG
jgi:hypothetical protein